MKPDKQRLYYEQMSFSGTPFNEVLTFYVRNDIQPGTRTVTLAGSYVPGTANEADA